MAWYRTGTVAVTNGNAVVTGTGTNFVENTQTGEAFLGPDGRVYEVGAVVSATALNLSGNYQGATAGGQGYALMPTSSFAHDLALGATQLLNTFSDVRDGVGKGLFPNGTLAAPGMRFAADQDTGVRRVGENSVALTAGGVDRLTASADGTAVAGNLRTRDRLYLQRTSGALDLAVAGYWDGTGTPLNGPKGNIVAIGNAGDGGLVFVNGDVERGRFDSSGSLLVGTTTSTYSAHSINRSTVAGNAVLTVRSDTTGFKSAVVLACDAEGWSASPAALWVGKTSSGRSINTGGTINASGADYAEYIRKAFGCAVILAGGVCGVSAEGLLVTKWSEALMYRVKSTNPNVVGGDSWSAHLGPRPEAPAQIGPEPAVDEVSTLHADWVRAKAAFDAAQAEYEIALPIWDAELEAARQTVDRIAYCGQVPVNFSGEFEPGDYLIAIEGENDSIAVASVSASAISFDQYRARLGRVLKRLDDGRALIDVQHG